MKKKTKMIYICIYSVLILVILICSIVLFVLAKEKSNNKLSNIVVPVIKKGDTMNFNIVVDNMKVNDKYNYYIKISNFRKKKINKQDIKYNIEFSTNDDVNLELYKYKNKKNLLNSNLKVENLKIKGKDKTSTIYVVRVKANKKIKNKQINVRITT